MGVLLEKRGIADFRAAALAVDQDPGLRHAPVRDNEAGRDRVFLADFLENPGRPAAGKPVALAQLSRRVPENRAQLRPQRLGYPQYPRLRARTERLHQERLGREVDLLAGHRAHGDDG
ncbi:hypothetical protein D3C83_59560 [compost metagenome]